MHTQEVGEKTFVHEVIRSDRPVLVHFYAAWCTQSLELGPIVEKIAEDMSADVKVVRIDAKRNARLCARLGALRLPTQILFVDGVLTDRIFGSTTAETLRDAVRSAAATHRTALAADDPKAVEIVDANFGRRVLQSDVPVIAVFWDRWCAASMKLVEHVDEAATRQKARVRVVRVQASQAPGICARLQVTRLPTTLAFRDGEVVDTIGGLLSSESVSKVLKAYA